MTMVQKRRFRPRLMIHADVHVSGWWVVVKIVPACMVLRMSTHVNLRVVGLKKRTSSDALLAVVEITIAA